MILDTIENSHLYEKLSERISKAFTYLKETDLKTLPEGKYPIDGDSIYASVQEYLTKNRSEGQLEGHKKYIDIQYVISGEELMGIAPLSTQKPVDINDEKDYTFYTGDAGFVNVKEGMFTIFFPTDLHMPCISVDQQKKVKKVVIKVKID